MDEIKSEDWLLLNAVECWLYYFPDHKYTPQYKELRQKMLALMKEEPTPTETKPVTRTPRKPKPTKDTP
jgi:hypothetical protein